MIHENKKQGFDFISIRIITFAYLARIWHRKAFQFMSRTRLIWITSLCLWANACLAASPDLIARIHFAGSTAIAADPEFRPFNNLFCSPNAEALQTQTLNKLARFPRAWIGTRASAKIGDGVPQIRPLLDDFVHSEWFLEAQDSGGIAPQFALAIHLSDDRARVWEHELTSLLTIWTGLPVQPVGGGWWLKKHEAPDSIRFLRVGEWVVLSCEQGGFPLGDELGQQIKATRRPVAAPTDYWLSVNANWDRLSRYFPGLRDLDLPNSTDLQLIGKAGNLSWNGKFHFAQSLPAYGNWQLPAGVLHPPLSSFTAARGIENWLQNQSWARPYLFSPPPNQLFTWATPGMPFMVYGAAPVSDGHRALVELNDAILKSGRPQTSPPNPFAFSPHTQLNNNQITFQGMPFATPFIREQHDSSGDFIEGGFFPSTQLARPLPPEITGRLATKNLVFFHWENTVDRLKNLPQLAQLVLLLSQHRQLNDTSLAQKWLVQIGPALGTSTTVGVQSGPNEVTFTRTGPGGLTAVELFALACWLEAPDFPGCNLKMPPPTFHPRPANSAPAKNPMPLLIH